MLKIGDSFGVEFFLNALHKGDAKSLGRIIFCWYYGI